MKNILLVYQAVALQNEERGRTDTPPSVITISVDEKPGVQAIANTAPDLLPVAGKHAKVARDHEYQRLGTCSILAALDLHDGLLQHASSIATAVSNSSHCSRTWTATIRRSAPSV